MDWLLLVAVAIAAVAAITHRNAVAGLEARGRAEAETFARILRGLSRSVSVDAIVGAIVDDLAEGTGADHVVVVRRRPEGRALEATLLTRREGVPNTSTFLPLGDLDLDPAHPPTTLAAIPIRPEAPREDVVLVGAAGAATNAGSSLGEPSAGTLPRVHRRTAESPARARLATWLEELAEDAGLPIPGRPRGTRGPLLAPRAEVVGSGASSKVASRIAERVRAVYGLSHTLAVPLQIDEGVIGAIVISRRDRDAWEEPARRLLEGAAIEASAALARAYSYREAAAHASTDPLTGLPNRRYFDEFCALLSRRRRSGDAVAVLMVDIDKFKVLNDTYGHAIGDQVLKAVASAIVSAVREEDVPARVGGEEFAVLLRNPGPNVAVEIGERVREAVNALDLRPHGVPGVSVSVGVANARGADEPIPAIVDRADRALYAAKRAGRDRVIAA